MAKTQINIRMEDDTAAMARQAAARRRVPVSQYVEQLIRDDNEWVRVRFMAAAQETLDASSPG
jgi:predicted HicB family RNase H-like nuclease